MIEEALKELRNKLAGEADKSLAEAIQKIDSEIAALKKARELFSRELEKIKIGEN